MAPGESQADFLPLDIRQAVSAGQKPIEMPVKLDAFIDADVVNGQKVEGIGWQDDDLKLAAFDLTGMLIGVQLQPESRPSQKQEDIFTQAKELIENKREDLLEKAANEGDTPEIQNQLRELKEFEENIIAVVDRNLHPEKFVTEEKKDPAVELKRVLNSATEIAQLNDVLGKIQGAVDSTDKSRQLPALEIEKLLAKLEANLTKLERFIPSHAPDQNPENVEAQRAIVIDFLDEKRKEISETKNRIFAEWKVRFNFILNVPALREILDGSVLSKTKTQQLQDLEAYKAKLTTEKSKVSQMRSYEEYVAGFDAPIASRENELVEAWVGPLEVIPFPDNAGRNVTLRESLNTYDTRFPGGSDYSGATQADVDDLTARIYAFDHAFEAYDRNPNQKWTLAQKARWETSVQPLKDHRARIESAFKEKVTADEFRKLMTDSEKDPPKKIKEIGDENEKFLADLKSRLENLKASLRETEYRALEEEFALFKFRFIKRIILNQIYSDMRNDSSSGSYVSEKQEAKFENKLKEIPAIVRLFEERGNAELAREISEDFERFKAKFLALRLAIYSGSSLAPQIIGSKDSTAGAQRKIPLQVPSWFPSTADMIYAIKNNPDASGISGRAELTFDGEKPFNKELPERRYQVPNFEEPEVPLFDERYKPNVLSDCRRIMDMIARDTLLYRMKSKINDRIEELGEEDGGQTQEELEVIKILESNALYKSIHIGYYNETVLPRVLECAANTLYGNTEVDIDVARTAWYQHILLLNFSAMAPASPSTDDQIYKAMQPISYIAKGSVAGTSGASPFHTACLVGVYNEEYETPTEDAADGVAYTLNRFVVRQSDLTPSRGLLERIGRGMSGVVVENGQSQNRNKVLEALEKDENLHEFRFLADLPFMVSHATVWKTIPFVPSPLQYMLIKDKAGQTYSKKNSLEKKVLRWRGHTPQPEGHIPRPVTAADYVTPVKYIDKDGKEATDYDILYEMIPFGDVLETTSLDQWYNNGKNIENLRKILYDPSSKDIFDAAKAAALQNDAKYIATFLPGEMGLNVAAGTYNGEKVFQRMTIVSVFARSIDLLTSTDLTLDKVEDSLLGLMRVLGEAGKKSHAVEAIITALKQVVGTTEESQQSLQEILNQVLKRLEFK